jgi:predicted O-linked N-acetylglucosamine transferase (SPINDLY family)
VLEKHDRARFRVIGYSWGPDDGSAARARVRAACDRFVELGGVADGAAVGRIRADGVQLLVDLKGHTADARPGLFVAGAAPVQVNWLGYPGTLGGAAWDAVLGDPIVTPPGCEADFSERVLRLPDCYQPNDPRRARPAAPASVADARAAHGLPTEAVLLCCMNAAWKIDAERFADWMAVLRAVPTAVLWLLDANPGHGLAVALRNAASAADVDPARLVFAPRAPHADYLARFALADLFLDTFPYTAHTTASDALWMGCPVLTETGTTFAARVATSLLHAVGLPELAVASRARYVEEAIALGREPARLRALRARLAQGRASAPLFDAVRFTAGLEAAYLELAAAARAAR